MEIKRIIDLLPNYKASYNRPDVLVSKTQGNWNSIGIDDFIANVYALSFGLMQAGILPNDKVAIISSNCPISSDLMFV
jgi:long-subunit acyl-CoA synthetase (AMP-forming)